ncbi:Phosphonate ABC transporter, periplasmic [Ferriphaselus amnicola]|uniref:Phosphonate ABC transporter, periplasmic n=1 Tax=Ferriphaselus amnicola TaxID=1188319 RepID=A0A2Z6GE19_9PROT|nr:phosphate/phosphite/phosphonate ABC transporter substrate-binding protein [Ferriphaselus amnicola]BBE51861.1 Phosphonate ABC transporter, periplasmic [Ferriphaselus amnicola]
MEQWKRLVLLIVVLLSISCDKQDEPVYQPTFSKESSAPSMEFIVGIHPLHNPQKLFEVYGPIVDLLNAKIPNAHFHLEASRNYEEFDKKLYSGYFDFAMPNPYQTVRSMKAGYAVFGKMGDDADFRGIILVRKDAGIRSVADLKGKKVSYPAITALAATMMPQYYLHTHGLDVNRDIENVYVGSQESSIMNVYLGQVSAGATWPVPWKAFVKEHPDKASLLEVKWQTEALLNNAWVVRKDVPPEMTQKVAVALFELNTSAEGRNMLERLPISRFEKANNATYKPVEDYLERFSKVVRPIER